MPEFAPRLALASKDARTLARNLLAMTQAEFSAMFEDSPTPRNSTARCTSNPETIVCDSSSTLSDVGTRIVRMTCSVHLESHRCLLDHVLIVTRPADHQCGERVLTKGAPGEISDLMGSCESYTSANHQHAGHTVDIWIACY